MFNHIDFEACIRANLKDRRFGKERADEIVKEFKERMNFHSSNGKAETDAGLAAMNDVFENLSVAAAEKAKRNAKTLAKQVELDRFFENALTKNINILDAKDVTSNRGQALGSAAIGVIAQNPIFGGSSYTQRFEAQRGRIWQLMDSVVEHMGKGFLGKSTGKAYMPNVVRELHGQDTGDMAAKTIAQAFRKGQDYAVDMFNQVGGSLKKLNNYFPQAMSSVKVSKAGVDEFINFHMSKLDWNKTRWPDGRMIDAADREKVLRDVYQTISTNGASKIDPTAFRGRGRAMGNMLEEHRFMHYKDADAWLEMHEKYGEGDVMDVITRYVNDMSHRIAAVDTFGPNPDAGFQNIKAVVMSKASKFGGEQVSKAEAALKKAEDMFKLVMRKNPVNPHSRFAAAAIGTGNVLRAALLAKAVLTAVPSDFINAMMVRRLNNMPVVGDFGLLLKNLTVDQKSAQRIAARTGYIHDDMVTSIYNAMRYSDFASYAPGITQRISDVAMRASGMAIWTRTARGTFQQEFMGLLAESWGEALDDLPFRQVLSRYDISKADWDTVRQAIQPREVAPGVKMFVPSDILDAKLKDGLSLYYKFHGMIGQEALHMVPDSTLESSVALRGVSRPDTIHGAILYSFSMYKNFPVTIANIHARLGMMKSKGRMGYYASVLAGMTMAGVIATQMKEIQNGRDTIPFDDTRLWMKGLATGGGLSIFGDFLFSGVNAFGQGPQDAAAGPLVALLGDTTDLVFGDIGRFIESVETGKDFEFKADEKLVRYLRRYNPVTNNWLVQTPINRLFWDAMEDLADPKAQQKREKRKKDRLKNYNQEYWWEEGEDAPERLPQISEGR